LLQENRELIPSNSDVQIYPLARYKFCFFCITCRHQVEQH
jgi:hypothetical protein